MIFFFASYEECRQKVQSYDNARPDKVKCEDSGIWPVNYCDANRAPVITQGMGGGAGCANQAIF